EQEDKKHQVLQPSPASSSSHPQPQALQTNSILHDLRGQHWFRQISKVYSRNACVLCCRRRNLQLSG
ncbi:hypothetical protein XENOCAPTIV_016260, partial [Xenoophorus captivus]